MLSIVIATIGRPSLHRTLESLQGQLRDLDEVLVVGDGDPENAGRMFRASGLPGRYIPIEGPNGDYGHTPRNKAMPQALGKHLLFIDDDDTYLPGAMDSVRRAIIEHPDRPILFKMKRPDKRFNDVLWTKRRVELGNVSTQMIVAPNTPAKLGVWGHRYAGDFDFLTSTIKHYQNGPAWRDEIIAVWGNPH